MRNFQFYIPPALEKKWWWQEAPVVNLFACTLSVFNRREWLFGNGKMNQPEYGSCCSDEYFNCKNVVILGLASYFLLLCCFLVFCFSRKQTLSTASFILKGCKSGPVLTGRMHYRSDLSEKNLRSWQSSCLHIVIQKGNCNNWNISKICLHDEFSSKCYKH